ncbi:MAG: septum formation protein Maf [Rhodobacteraceae bacterium]|jgi:septum formation protein|nr:septum formation protein Maf [Paracoccaceae bacterium]
MSLILASASSIRASLLRRAGVAVEVVPARIDEEAVRLALAAEAARPREVADTLAEHKARKVSERFPDALVLGCDQVLDLDGTVLGKPVDIDAARTQLRALRGRSHRLFAAAVLYHSARPVWRHVGEARLTMRSFSDFWLEGYLARNGAGLCESAGAYKIEEEGVRLFSRVEGDHFSILGLPLIQILDVLTVRGELPG